MPFVSRDVRLLLENTACEKIQRYVAARPRAGLPFYATAHQWDGNLFLVDPRRAITL
jgi:hypothetical protein